MKRVALEFSEGNAVDYERELTEAEAQKFGVKLQEQVTPDVAKLRKKTAIAYQALGLTEAEAKLAADLDLTEAEPHGLGLRF